MLEFSFTGQTTLLNGSTNFEKMEKHKFWNIKYNNLITSNSQYSMTRKKQMLSENISSLFELN